MFGSVLVSVKAMLRKEGLFEDMLCNCIIRSVDTLFSSYNKCLLHSM